MAIREQSFQDTLSDLMIDSTDNGCGVASSSFPLLFPNPDIVVPRKNCQEKSSSKGRQQPRQPFTGARLPDVRSNTEEKDGGNGVESTKKSDTLLQLQREICDCTHSLLRHSNQSATEQPPPPPLPIHDQQSPSKVLGNLFGATKKIISLIEFPSTTDSNSRSDPSMTSPEVSTLPPLPIRSHEPTEVRPAQGA